MRVLISHVLFLVASVAEGSNLRRDPGYKAVEYHETKPETAGTKIDVSYKPVHYKGEADAEVETKPVSAVAQKPVAKPSEKEPVAKAQKTPMAAAKSVEMTKPKSIEYNEAKALEMKKPKTIEYNAAKALEMKKPKTIEYKTPATATFTKPAAVTYKTPATATFTKPAAVKYTKPADASKPATEITKRVAFAVAKPSETKPAAKAETKPVAVTKPAAETKPTAAANPVAAAKPAVEPTKPMAAAKPVAETKPVAAAKPMVAAKPAAEKKPAAAATKPVVAAKPAVAAKPVVAADSAVAKKLAPHAALAIGVSHAQGEKTAEEPATVHDHAVAAQHSADDAAHHLAEAKKAYAKTKMNVKDILKTGDKIEDTAGDIKKLYTPEGGEAPKKAEIKEAPAPEQPKPEPQGGGLAGLDKMFDAKGKDKQMQRNQGINVVLQLLFALFYYVTVVKHYPSFKELPDRANIPIAAKDLQAENEVSSTLKTSAANCVLSYFCPGPRAAHTFNSALGYNYWLGCFLATCFPCCTLWYFNTFTKLNENLGGKKRNVVMGLFCSCLCSCCVIAQDAETLDRIHNVETRFCGVWDKNRFQWRQRK